MRWQKTTVSGGFILLIGCAILGNRLTTIENFTPIASTIAIANETRAHKIAFVDNSKDDRKSIQSCFDAVNLLSRHIHEDQETHGLRQCSLSLDDGVGPIDFPGLDDNLIQASFGGRRIFFMGDSTTKNLHNWLYRLLLRMHQKSPYNISLLSDMNLRDANSMVAGCGRNLVCDDPQSNRTELNNLHMRLKQDDCSNKKIYAGTYESMTDHEPEIIVANIGLWLLHFEARGRDRKVCAAENFIHYEHWLEDTLKRAEEVGAQALFFKTTNTICTDKYTGDYAKADKLYAMMDNETLLDCFNSLKANRQEDELSDEDIHNYCANGTFNNRGVVHLNQRLYKFVESHRNTASLSLHVFDDNIIKSCEYTGRGDARHYHPLNLVRIRLLAHLISCIE
ncbi:hypothetical protein ACHAWU_001127 [Discostella pseudostelligera]|uniref:Uncharacterized protein n=1 Tax=Discostella pseudostelligera TaxID=259834 RepID=A0ABD3MFU3_9STRA